MTTSVSFRTTLAGSEGMTGIVVPDDAVARLGAGRRPAVHVELAGHAYRSTVALMGGQSMIAVSAAVREVTGLSAGDPVDVVLTVATEPREVDVPDELAVALAADPRAAAFFAALSNSLQRYHADTVREAKSPETRQRRADKALALFREGKKR